MSHSELIQSASGNVIIQLKQVQAQITHAIILSEQTSSSKNQQSSYANLNGYETAKIQSLHKEKAIVDALINLISRGETVDLNYL